MTYEEMKAMVADHCDTVSYDKTRDWKSDSRTAEDPDDTQEVQPVKPVLNFVPKAARGR
jgi:hypothetical protein